MKNQPRHSGLTLTELLVVVAIMAVLMAIAVPAVKGLMDSFDSTTSVRKLINAALSSARATAIREQAYAGIRFQQDAQGDTYMIFIVHDPIATGLANGFKALPGRKPMKLPQDVGVLANTFSSTNTDTANDLLLDSDIELTNANTFSVVFSPSGKMVVHLVRVRNKDGKTETDSTATLSNDLIFNTKPKVDAGIGKFYQDDYYFNSSWTPDLGLAEEDSMTAFFLYNKKDFRLVQSNQRYTNYFKSKYSEYEYISPYTGELMIEYRNAQNP